MRFLLLCFLLAAAPAAARGDFAYRERGFRACHCARILDNAGRWHRPRWERYREAPGR